MAVETEATLGYEGSVHFSTHLSIHTLIVQMFFSISINVKLYFKQFKKVLRTFRIDRWHIKAIWSIWLYRNLRGHNISPFLSHSVPSLYQRRDLQSLCGMICGLDSRPRTCDLQKWTTERHRKREEGENRNLTAVSNIVHPNIWNHEKAWTYCKDNGSLVNFRKDNGQKQTLFVVQNRYVLMLDHKASHKSH